MAVGIKFKGTRIAHILKDETHTFCGMDINNIPHNSDKKREYTPVETEGLKCASDIKMGDEFPEYVMCSRCNMWAHYGERR